MRWESGRRSDNVEDRRGLRVTRGIAGGGLGTIVLVLVALYFGVDPSTIVNSVPSGDGARVEQSNEPRPAAENRLAEFASVVLADTEDTWGAIFREKGRSYETPKLVLFTDAVESACGLAGRQPDPSTARRPQLYVDLSFFSELAGASAPRAIRPGVCHRTRGRAPRAESPRHRGQGSRGAGPGGRARGESPLGAPGAAGGLLRRVWATALTKPGGCSTPATSKRRCARPPRSGTIAFSVRPAGAWCRTASRTGHPSSESAGSAAASRTATSPAATPSPPGSFNR